MGEGKRASVVGPLILVDLAVVTTVIAPFVISSQVLHQLPSPKLIAAFVGVYCVWRLSTISDYLKRCAQTAARDLKGVVLLFKVRLKLWRAFRTRFPIHHYLLGRVKDHPDKDCVIEVESGRSFTFHQFNSLANRYANHLQARHSLRRGAVVALFLENGVDFLALWVGLSKLGVVSAWINSNLKKEPLLHSLRISHASLVITSSRLLPVLTDALAKFKNGNETKFDILSVDGVGSCKNGLLSRSAIQSLSDFRTSCDSVSGNEEPMAMEHPNFQDILCYIYTSGTTGHPKAAIIKHYRYYLMAMGSGHAFGVLPTDRIYIHMPMYHSAGGILGVGQMLINGCTLVVRRKFSASSFWNDCALYRCTASQYIGEICRYLMTQPDCDNNRSHPVRLMYGNGMRPEIWAGFVERFGIRRVGEFYGSTEGISNILNVDNHTGSCGFMPIYECLMWLYPIRLIKVDQQTGEPLRNSNGLCVLCRPGETGEMIGLIQDKNPILRFEGYVDRAETSKKVIRNVLRQGDSAFASGDLLHWDRLGYLYFVDRRGDTYRWRGENVSTTQVEGIIQPMVAILDAAVYGVVVKGREGRAGMLAVSLCEGKEFKDFVSEVGKLLRENLPSYAVPVFLRVCHELDRTGTFKLKKAALQLEGYDPSKCRDDLLFYWNSTQQSYLPLTEAVHSDIEEGIYDRI